MTWSGNGRGSGR